MNKTFLKNSLSENGAKEYKIILYNTLLFCMIFIAFFLKIGIDIYNIDNDSYIFPLPFWIVVFIFICITLICEYKRDMLIGNKYVTFLKNSLSVIISVILMFYNKAIETSINLWVIILMFFVIIPFITDLWIVTRKYMPYISDI